MTQLSTQWSNIDLSYSLLLLFFIFYQMPQKKNRKRQKQASPSRNAKNLRKKDSKSKDLKHKKAASPLRHKSNNRLYQSVGASSFQNKKIKHVLSQKSQPKSSSTQRDVSTGIFEEFRPNRQYYGPQTSLYINTKCHSSSNAQISKHTSKTKRPKNEKVLCKILKTYRSLQEHHIQQISQYSKSVTKTELHRLRRIQQCELRKQMEKLVQIQWKNLCKRR